MEVVFTKQTLPFLNYPPTLSGGGVKKEKEKEGVFFKTQNEIAKKSKNQRSFSKKNRKRTYNAD